jgi:hypothetical protein
LWHSERDFVTGNDLPRIVAHRCVIEASIGKSLLHSGRHWATERAAFKSLPDSFGRLWRTLLRLGSIGTSRPAMDFSELDG